MTTSTTDLAQIELEVEALRGGLAVSLRNRDVLRLGGKDVLSYLQGQCSQDIANLAVGEAAEALLLSPQGKLDAYVRVIRTGDEEVLVDVDGCFGDAVLARLLRFKLRVKVEIDQTDLRCLSVRGNKAILPTSVEGALAVPYQWGTITGYDIIGSDPLAPPLATEASAEAFEALRIEAGIPQMGRELDEKTIPEEAGLIERTVSFSKGCYTGQELVARIDSRGNNVPRRLRGLLLLGESEPGAVASVGSVVSHNQKDVGSVTSACWSPTLKVPIALAYISRSVGIGDVVDVAGGRQAKVSELPFVP